MHMRNQQPMYISMFIYIYIHTYCDDDDDDNDDDDDDDDLPAAAFGVVTGFNIIPKN